jgi:hypothetical protein
MYKEKCLISEEGHQKIMRILDLAADDYQNEELVIFEHLERNLCSIWFLEVIQFVGKFKFFFKFFTEAVLVKNLKEVFEILDSVENSLNFVNQHVNNFLGN